MTEQPGATTRPVAADDLARIVELDQEITGQSRRGFFEKRLAAGGRDQSAFASLVIESDGEIAGYVFAHILDGEFGGKEPVAVLDAIGVAPRGRGHHLGRQLMAALDRRLQGHGVREIQTQAAWTEHELVRFFAGAGFELAPRLVLERSTAPLS